MLVVMAQIYLIELVLLACRLSCFQSSSNRFFLSGNSQHADLKASDGLFEPPQSAGSSSNRIHKSEFAADLKARANRVGYVEVCAREWQCRVHCARD